ncbi:MAG: hypothetical protein IJP81_08460 [Bacteroidales bacterium]|nr:hypothetical protein [Bacteroidales bacterium]
MLILQQAISISQLKELAQNTFGDMIKCVADVKRGLLDFIEFDSLINIRSWQGNPSRGVEDPDVREAIKSIVDKFITA